FRLKADFDWADRFLGINQVNVTYSQGIQGLGSSENNNNFDPNVGDSNPNLLSNPVGRVDFEKIEAKLSRSQVLFGPVSAFGSIYGQYAFNPLLVSEQCGYGGRFFGRAFDPSALLGDHCVEAIGELRYDLAHLPAVLSQVQFYAYSDYGRLWALGPGFIDAQTGGISGNTDAASAGGGVRLGFWNTVTADPPGAQTLHGPA